MGCKFDLAERELELVLGCIEVKELECIEVKGGQCIREETEKEITSSK
jgi:hypothetical protein